MATCGTISTMVDGKCVGIYTHLDSYPNARIPLLLENYNSQEMAESIVALGAISSLRERISPNEDESHSFDSAIKDVTIAYHRDRDEEFSQLTGSTKDDVAEEEYSYHFEDGEWLYRDNNWDIDSWEKCSEWAESE